MAANHVVAPEAELDLVEAYVWYEDRRTGLGEEFLGSVDACVQRICRNPEAFEVVHESYRRALVRRFPYAVFFDHDNELVTIYCVFHTVRDPEKWRQRLG
jgi:plasmid stabilization system protein ParE